MRQNLFNDSNYFRYLPVAESDELWMLYTTTVGRSSIAPGESYPAQADEHPPSYTHNWPGGRILNEYQFVYIVEGCGRFRCFHGESVISPGTVLTLLPGERHWYMPDSNTHWREYWIGFKGEVADAWLERRFLNREEPVFRLGSNRELRTLFEQCIVLAQKEPPCMQQLLSSRIPQIQALIHSMSQKGSAVSEEDIFFDRARLLFEEHIYDKFDIEEITRSLSVSYYTLREYFKQYTGMSPYHYFLQMKINRAKELLLRGEMSVKEVSYKLAFDSPYYFSRLFKKKTGVSPSRWHGKHQDDSLELWKE